MVDTADSKAKENMHDPSQEEMEEKGIWKEEKRKLMKLIGESKRIKWKELIEEVDEDVWGRPYQIVVRRTGMTVRTTYHRR